MAEGIRSVKAGTLEAFGAAPVDWDGVYGTFDQLDLGLELTAHSK